MIALTDTYGLTVWINPRQVITVTDSNSGGSYIQMATTGASALRVREAPEVVIANLTEYL